jgi:hypothetical protein
VLFHHLPDASDDYLDELEAKWMARSDDNMRITLAREGDTLNAEG